MNTGRKIIIASNREPYSTVNRRTEKTVGGLVSALDPLMRSSSGTWIASGKKSSSAPVPPGDPMYLLRRVGIGASDMEGYYNGFSNRFLWPLCHMTLDRVYLRRSYWKSYMKVNRLFADAVAEEAGGGDPIIWLHDYHLALCASYIRAQRPYSTISLFWHIPWPPHAVFRICPQRKELLEGLLGNDLLGFQLDSFKVNFMRCVEQELDARVDYENGTIERMGRTTYLKAFPISIDFEWFERASSSPGSDDFVKRLRKKRGLRDFFLGLSVNRVDYTKGMIKGLEAIELFFTKYPGYRSRVSFIQVAVPTRKVEPFLSYMERVRKKVESINRRFSNDGWRPVEFLNTNLSHAELASLYKHSKLAIISSVYDGMNLVAKEYIACQNGCEGAVLVSEFAGASEDIPGVTVINPYDTEGCADAIKKAIEARPAEKRKAMELARGHLRRNDIYKWVKDIFSAIEGLEREQIPLEITGPDRVTVKR